MTGVWWMATMKWGTELSFTSRYWNRNKRPSPLATSCQVTLTCQTLAVVWVSHDYHVTLGPASPPRPDGVCCWSGESTDAVLQSAAGDFVRLEDCPHRDHPSRTRQMWVTPLVSSVDYTGVSPRVWTLTLAIGERTPGASVQKPGALAASKQDVYASEDHMTSHVIVT